MLQAGERQVEATEDLGDALDRDGHGRCLRTTRIEDGDEPGEFTSTLLFRGSHQHDPRHLRTFQQVPYDAAPPPAGPPEHCYAHSSACASVTIAGTQAVAGDPFQPVPFGRRLA